MSKDGFLQRTLHLDPNSIFQLLFTLVPPMAI
jgi:hypothetical protein